VPRIAIVAGEISGDRLGAGLIRAVRARRPDVQFAGVVGPAMRAAGADEWMSSDELSVMGLAEVVRHLPRLRRVLRDLESRMLADPPDLFIGIDAPDFNLRLERNLKGRGIHTIHYVSPSVWAWRSGRVRVLRQACDSVLCLLPFEADFLEANGVRGVFVGHPLADELADPPDQASARRALGIAAAGPVVAILPGSRAGEVARLGEVFLATASWLAARVPGISFVVPMATPELRKQFEDLMRKVQSTAAVTIVDGQSHAAMASADAILLASGTATLEAMLLRRPMVVAYRMAPLTYTLLRTLRLVHVNHMALPNLLAGERLVPELLQAEVTPAALGGEILSLLESPAGLARLQARFGELADQLRRGASGRAADIVLEAIEGS
jgi:lipid-A-disaccharide synthase